MKVLQIHHSEALFTIAGGEEGINRKLAILIGMHIRKLDVLFAVGAAVIAGGVAGAILTKDILPFLAGAVIGGMLMAISTTE